MWYSFHIVFPLSPQWSHHFLFWTQQRMGLGWMWLLVCLSFPVSSGLGLPLPAVNSLPRGGDRRKASFFLFFQHHDPLSLGHCAAWYNQAVFLGFSDWKVVPQGSSLSCCGQWLCTLPHTYGAPFSSLNLMPGQSVCISVWMHSAFPSHRWPVPTLE